MDGSDQASPQTWYRRNRRVDGSALSLSSSKNAVAPDHLIANLIMRAVRGMRAPPVVFSR